MTVREILELNRPQMKKYLPQLADVYRQTTGRDICLTCWGDINYMITYLKNEQKMSTNKFRLKNDLAIYKMEKGSPRTIRQDILTDELAIEYIKINPERIALFSHFPEDWRQLCGLVEDQTEDHDDCCEDEEEEPCLDCLKASLMKQTLPELKEQWKDDVKFYFGMKKTEYVDAIAQHKLENQ